MKDETELEVNGLNLYELIQKYGSEDAAREFVEALRWPDGPVCPHCGSMEAYRLTPKQGSKTRKGLLKCKYCRKQFTVTVNSIFADSHIPLSKWVLAIHLLCASKKGVSAHQIHRMIGMTYKSAWFMMHRIRLAMTESPEAAKLTGIVEADETYFGGKAKNMHAVKKAVAIQGRGPVNKVPVMTLVERNGRVRTTQLERVNEENLDAVLRTYVDRNATLMTDDAPCYDKLGKDFAGHQSVNHSVHEYVRETAHINSAESVHAILKRGVFGIYHHWSVQHLGRYLVEFDFRYNARKISDGKRAAMVVKGAADKRLMYRTSKGGQ